MLKEFAHRVAVVTGAGSGFGRENSLIAASARNRPPGVQPTKEPSESMKAAQRATEKAVSSGIISAADVAEMAFRAIENDQFYIVTHEKIMVSIRTRAQDIASLRNPTDPYAQKKDVAPNL